MTGLSTKPEYLIQNLSLYTGIQVELVNKSPKKVASFLSPPQGHEKEGKPFIRIFNEDSKKIYQICEKYDYGATQCIMNLIRDVFIVPEGEESLFYIIFMLLHEAGHWVDYHNRREWFNQNYSDKQCDTPEEYRNMPCEKSADRFALEHFENAWTELNESLFIGLLEPLEKTC